MNHDEEPLEGEELLAALRQITIELEVREKLLREGETLLNSTSPVDKARLAAIEMRLGSAVADPSRLDSWEEEKARDRAFGAGNV